MIKPSKQSSMGASPSREDVARIKLQCEDEHYATSQGKSALQKAREDDLYCASKEQNLLKASMTRAKRKALSLEIKWMEGNILIWEDKHDKLMVRVKDRAVTRARRKRLDNAIATEYRKIESRKLILKDVISGLHAKKLSGLVKGSNSEWWDTQRGV